MRFLLLWTVNLQSITSQKNENIENSFYSQQTLAKAKNNIIIASQRSKTFNNAEGRNKEIQLFTRTIRKITEDFNVTSPGRVAKDLAKKGN